VQRFLIGMFSLVVAVSAVKLMDHFVDAGERSHQAECIDTLRSVCFAERQAMASKQHFFTQLGEMPTPIPRGNRFAYFLAPGAIEDRSTESSAPKPDANGVDADLVGWNVPQGMKQHVLPGDLPQSFAGGVPLGVSGNCPECQLVAACAGNLDVDEELDIWSVSTSSRTTDAGEVPPCVPYHDHTDLH
jgi:hypothetical protein